MSINRVFLAGNITREPQTRQTNSGMTILSFGLAVNDRKRNPQTNEWEDSAQFFDCNILGKRADALSTILTKGMKVSVEGRLHYSSWEKDGQKRSKVDVTVDEIEFMSRRSDNGGGQQQSYQPHQQYQQPQQHYQRPQGRPNYQPGQQTITSVEQDAIPDVYDANIPF